MQASHNARWRLQRQSPVKVACLAWSYEGATRTVLRNTEDLNPASNQAAFTGLYDVACSAIPDFQARCSGLIIHQSYSGKSTICLQCVGGLFTVGIGWQFGKLTSLPSCHFAKQAFGGFFAGHTSTVVPSFGTESIGSHSAMTSPFCRIKPRLTLCQAILTPFHARPAIPAIPDHPHSRGGV